MICSWGGCVKQATIYEASEDRAAAGSYARALARNDKMERLRRRKQMKADSQDGQQGTARSKSIMRYHASAPTDGCGSPCGSITHATTGGAHVHSSPHNHILQTTPARPPATRARQPAAEGATRGRRGRRCQHEEGSEATNQAVGARSLKTRAELPTSVGLARCSAL